ncbi:MAG: hypothetical protein IM582_00735 [Chitinophagaceae bacterium]|nr:hypothetical protein [Chitinophagaceae bacterium]
MDFGILLLTIIGVSLLILLIWNLASIRQLKNRSKTDRNLDDPRYYELKYKQEFFVATVSLVGTVLVIFGYNSLQNVEKALKDDFTIKNAMMSKRTDSIISYFDTAINKRISATDKSLQTISASSMHLLQKTTSQLQNTQNTLEGYKHNLEMLSSQQAVVDDKVKNVQGRITDINAKNILKQNFYLVDSLFFDTRIMYTVKSEESYYTKYYFKDMKTLNGDKLPQFKKPPFLITSVEDMPVGQTGTVKDVTTESFKFNLPSWREERSRIFRFSIFISEKP